MSQRRAVIELHLLSRTDLNRWALSCGFAFTLPDGNHGGVSVGIYIESVIAWFGERERKIRRVYFPTLTVVQFANVDVQRALVQRNLHHIIVDVRES